MNENVSIVIVSHSCDVARGTADMVRQMVGEEIQVAFCGGDPAGGLGTSVETILQTLQSVYTPKGVAVLVDLGGAETNTEMAIEMLPPDQSQKIAICKAPIVEGAVMAGIEAAGGASLIKVCTTAEEFLG